MEFEYSDKVKPLQEKLRRFMDEHIYPNEQRHDDEIEHNTRQGRRWTPLKLAKPISNLADWRNYWDGADTDAVDGRVRYHGGDVLTRLQRAPEKVTPDDIRLRLGR